MQTTLPQRELIRRQLQREIRYGEKTTQRHTAHMRQMMRQLAEPQIRADVEVSIACFERAVDSKDCEISLLIDELQAVREQCELSSSNHVEDIDRIIVLCHDQIADLQRGTRVTCDNMYKAATTERTDVALLAHEHENFLKTMQYMLKQTNKSTIKSMRGELLSQNEVQIARMNDMTLKFEHVAGLRVQELQQDFERFLNDYMSMMRTKSSLFDALNKSDLAMQTLIARQWQRLRDSLFTVKVLRSAFRDMRAERAKKILEVRQEEAFYKRELHTTLRAARAETRLDDDNLTVLITASNEAIAFLGNFCSLGDRILSLASVCRKYETKREQVLQFPTFDVLGVVGGGRIRSAQQRTRSRASANLEAATAAAATATSARDDDDDEEETEEFMPGLRNFWLRSAAANSQRYKMCEMVRRIKTDVEKHKHDIFNYCHCVTCPS